MGIEMTLGKPTWYNGSTLAQNAKDVGLNPALGEVFPIFITPTTYIYIYTNIVPRGGIEPTSLAFLASVLPLHHVGSLMSPLYPWLPVYVAPCLRVIVDYYTHPAEIVSIVMLTIACIHTLHICDHNPVKLQCVALQDPGHGNQCRVCDENGKYCVQSRN